MDKKVSFKEIYSMQEKRVSTIIICLIAFVGLSFYLFISKGDIPETLLTIIQTLVYIVGGVNGLNIVTKGFSSKVSDNGIKGSDDGE